VRFVVAQIGARRGYAVPAILEQAGLLEHFYTDLTADVGLGRWLVKCGPLMGFGRAASRLARRRLPECIRGKTTTFAWPSLWFGCNRALCERDPAEKFREQLRWDRTLGSAMVRRGFGQATHLYTMLGECAPILAEARRRGLGIVTEVYILLSTERILKREHNAFPAWETAAPDFDAVRREFPEQEALLTHTDFAVCPSEVVRRDLVENFGFPAARSDVVPYGLDKSWLSLHPRTVAGRVLFVGTAGLRKGIHYLGAAAGLLRARRRNYEFQVAGDVSPQTAIQPECRCLEFLGRVPPDQMRQLYVTADVFVLPSLAEGSAEATYEALAAGLPVITTAAAGSVVRDGIDGRIVPERDAVALARAIEELVENRPARARMSAAARRRALDYELERYGERLMAALRSFTR